MGLVIVVLFGVIFAGAFLLALILLIWYLKRRGSR
jgi:hypothetical protein